MNSPLPEETTSLKRNSAIFFSLVPFKAIIGNGESVLVHKLHVTYQRVSCGSQATICLPLVQIDSSACNYYCNLLRGRMMRTLNVSIKYVFSELLRYLHNTFQALYYIWDGEKVFPPPYLLLKCGSYWLVVLEQFRHNDKV